MPNGETYHRIRSIRISDKVFEELKKHKQRGQSWDSYLKELLIKYKNENKEDTS